MYCEKKKNIPFNLVNFEISQFASDGPMENIAVNAQKRPCMLKPAVFVLVCLTF